MEENIKGIYYKRRGERLTLEKKKEDGSEERVEGAAESSTRDKERQTKRE